MSGVENVLHRYVRHLQEEHYTLLFKTMTRLLHLARVHEMSIDCVATCAQSLHFATACLTQEKVINTWGAGLQLWNEVLLGPDTPDDTLKLLKACPVFETVRGIVSHVQARLTEISAGAAAATDVCVPVLLQYQRDAMDILFQACSELPPEDASEWAKNARTVASAAIAAALQSLDPDTVDMACRALGELTTSANTYAPVGMYIKAIAAECPAILKRVTQVAREGSTARHRTNAMIVLSNCLELNDRDTVERLREWGVIGVFFKGILSPNAKELTVVGISVFNATCDFPELFRELRQLPVLHAMLEIAASSAYSAHVRSIFLEIVLRAIEDQDKIAGAPDGFETLLQVAPGAGRALYHAFLEAAVFILQSETITDVSCVVMTLEALQSILETASPGVHEIARSAMCNLDLGDAVGNSYERRKDYYVCNLAENVWKLLTSDVEDEDGALYTHHAGIYTEWPTERLTQTQTVALMLQQFDMGGMVAV